MPLAPLLNAADAVPSGQHYWRWAVGRGVGAWAVSVGEMVRALHYAHEVGDALEAFRRQPDLRAEAHEERAAPEPSDCVTRRVSEDGAGPPGYHDRDESPRVARTLAAKSALSPGKGAPNDSR